MTLEGTARELITGTAALAAGFIAGAATISLAGGGDKYSEAPPGHRPAEQPHASAGTIGSGCQPGYVSKDASVLRGNSRTDTAPPGLGPMQQTSGGPTPLQADHRAGRRPTTGVSAATATEAIPETAAGGDAAGAAEAAGGTAEAGAIGERAARGPRAGTGTGTTWQGPGEGVVPNREGVGRGEGEKPHEVQPQTNEYMPSASDHASVRPPKPSGAAVVHSARLEEELATMHDKYEKLKDRHRYRREQYKESVDHLNTQLEEEKRFVDAQRQDYEQKLARLGSQLEEEKALAAAQRQSFERELNRLNSLHIRSVNLTGTGLEPVSDQEFGTAIRDLRDQVPPLPPPPPPGGACGYIEYSYVVDTEN